MKFEDILDDVGSFGWYQKLLCFTIIPLTTGVCSLVYYAQIFALAAPRHFCRVSNEIENQFASNDSFTYQETENYYLQLTNATRDQINTKHFECSNYKRRNGFSSVPTNETLPEELLDGCQHKWVYDAQNMFSTLTSENDWICNEAWKPYIIISCFWIGNAIGAWIFGTLSDLLGRKPTIALSSTIYGMAGIASSFVKDFYGHLALRILVGSAHHTISHLPFVFVIEFCGIKSRVIPVFVVMVTYTIGSILAPVLAWTLWKWNNLIILASSPSLIVLLLYKWLPESPSWLMTKNRQDAAVEVLHQISRTNGRPKSKKYLKDFIEALNVESIEEKPIESFSQFRNYSNLSKNILLVMILWMLGCMCYYGHCQNTTHLSDNIFKSYFFAALVEIPAWGTPYIMHKFGRKCPLTTTFLLSGIAGVTYAFLPDEISGVSFVIALLGRMFITASYYVTLQLGPEIFPTVIRGRGVALLETLGGIAILTSPLIVYTVHTGAYLYRGVGSTGEHAEFMTKLPLLIFAGLSLMGGTLTLFIPETGGVTLPQTLQEGEEFATRQKSICSCRSKK